MKAKKIVKDKEDPAVTKMKRKAALEHKGQLKEIIQRLQRQLKEVEAGATATKEYEDKLPLRSKS